MSAEQGLLHLSTSPLTFASGLRNIQFAQFGITQELSLVQSPYSMRILPSIDEKSLLVEDWS
jgi:hypothetical protein